MTARSKPNLKLVQPNLEEMERVLTEAAKHQAPMIQRAESTRQKLDTELKALENERATVVDRQQLAIRHHEALMQGFAAELADIDKAMGLYTGGLTQDALAGGAA